MRGAPGVVERIVYDCNNRNLRMQGLRKGSRYKHPYAVIFFDFRKTKVPFKQAVTASMIRDHAQCYSSKGRGQQTAYVQEGGLVRVVADILAV